MNRHDSTQKLTPEHLARKAVVYLRQSSMAQVKHNQESQRLQYALADTAKAYGFKQVEIVDCDLGMSAATGSQARDGFKRVLASVALGEVGMVLSRELSRLSRTDKDWCQLIELCQIFNTLIADAENLYDLNRLDDQLVLGIKGTLSVVELKTLKFRLQQGREEKAKRGELGRCLAPGYVADPLGQIVKDPNLRVQEAMALVFKKFHELGRSARPIAGFTRSESNCRSIRRAAVSFGWCGNCRASALSATFCTIPSMPVPMCTVAVLSR